MPWLDDTEDSFRAAPPVNPAGVRAVRVIVRGRVQGVGFRWWVVSIARRYGVRGVVGNRPDGSVEIFAEADEKTLSAFVSEMDSGPPLARVDSVETASAAVRGLRDFRVAFFGG